MKLFMNYNTESTFCFHIMNQNTSTFSYKHLSDIHVMKCLALAWFKTSQKEIIRELGCDQLMIRHILRVHKYEMFQECIFTLKSMCKTTIIGDRLLVYIAKKNHMLPFCDIINISCLPILWQTMAYWYRKVKFINWYATWKPFLTTKHKKD